MSLNAGACFQQGLSLSEGKRIDHSGHGDRLEREEAGYAEPATGVSSGEFGGRISRMRTRRGTLP